MNMTIVKAAAKQNTLITSDIAIGVPSYSEPAIIDAMEPQPKVLNPYRAEVVPVREMSTDSAQVRQFTCANVAKTKIKNKPTIINGNPPRFVMAIKANSKLRKNAKQDA